MEDHHFRELFEARIGIVLHVWSTMKGGGFLPEKSRPMHLLWTLYFLKVYPREATGCSAIGSGGGAIDPKTLRKWVWLFIERIAELADKVVSIFFYFVIVTLFVDSHFQPPRLPPPPDRSISRAGLALTTWATTASCQSTGPTSASCRRVPPLHRTSMRGIRPYAMSLGLTSSRGIWCGSADLTPPVSGTT